jgi:hypothetical protein
MKTIHKIEALDSPSPPSDPHPIEFDYLYALCFSELKDLAMWPFNVVSCKQTDDTKIQHGMLYFVCRRAIARGCELWDAVIQKLKLEGDDGEVETDSRST